MAVIIPGDVPVDQNAPTTPFTDPLDGGTLISLFATPDYFLLQPTDPVDTTQVDLVFPAQLGPETFDSLMATLNTIFLQAGQEILAYAVYERGELDISVPTQFSLLGQVFTIPPEICFGPICLGVGGQTLASGYTYRLWILSGAIPAAVRPMMEFAVAGFGYPATNGLHPGMSLVAAPFLPALTIVALAVAIVGGLIGIVAVIKWASGSLKWSEISGFFHDTLTSPGQNVAAAAGGFTWPLVAATVALLGGAILIPLVATRYGFPAPVTYGGADVTVPLPGGARVGAVGGVGARGKR